MRLRLGFLLVLMAALATAPTCLGMTSPQAVTLKDFPGDFNTFLTNPPAAVTSFLPTDAHVALAVAVSGQQLGDVISVDYVMQSGQVSSALSHAWSALTGDNIGLPYLMVLDMLQIAGQPPASTPGQWSAKFYYHPASSTTRTLLTTLTFTIGTAGGGGGGSCTYTLGATSASVVAGAVSGTVSVTAPNGCSWTAVSNNTSWLTVYGGSSGSGNAYVTYMVTANSSTSSRTGTLTVAGQTFTVTQAGAFSGSNLTVNTIYLQGGSYSAGNFNVNAGYFSTAHGFFNYPLGVSAPSTSSPLLNASDWSINIPPGTYYLYLANKPATIGSAVMLTVMWSDGSQSDSIFSVGSLNGTGNWPLIQDSGFLSLGGTGITNANRVNTTGLSPDSSSNIVLTLTITAPGAGGGGGGGGSCSYTLGSASASLAASATTGTVSVTAASGCTWTAVSNNTSWLTVTSGANGSGNGTVGYSVTANSGSSARTGTITIGGQTFTVSQAAAASCSYTLGAASASLAASATTGTVSVTAASGCAWTAVSNNTSWLTVTSGASGSGNGTVNYSVTANSGSSTRTGTITIGGQTFTVSQAAASACWYQLTPTSQSMGGAFWSGSVAVSAPVGCPWTAVSNATWITVTSGGSGSGNGMFYYSVATNPDTTVRSGAITVMGQAFSIQQFGSNPTCNYMIGVPWASAPAGGTPGTVSVSAESGCTWTAVSNNTSWLTVTSGATGSGNGTVVYSVAANTSSSSRTGTITIAGQTFTVAQVGATGTDVVLAVDGGTFARTLGFNQGLPHVYFVNRLTPSSYPATLKNVQIYFGNRSNGLPVNNPITVVWAAASGGGNTLSGGAFTTLPAAVTALGSFDTYTVSPMTIASGDFLVGFEVDNPPGIYPADVDTSSPSQQRSYYSTDGVTFGLLDAAGLAGNLAIRATVTLGSGSGAGGTCTASISPTSQTIAASGGSGSVGVTDGNGCTWTANSSDSWASITSGASGSGNGTVQYSVAANTGTSARTATLTIAGLAFTITQSGTSGGGGGGGGANATGITLEGGAYASGTFSGNQQVWDTLSSSTHWVLGVSAPSVTSPLLNASDKSVNIPAGTYYLYSEPTAASFGTAARLTVQWSGGGQDQAIFTPASLSTSGNWTRLSGSTNLSLASTGITNANRVSSTLSAGGDSDNVLQLTIGASSAGGGGGGGCTYQLESPATTAMPASTTGSLAISTQTGCPWTAVSNASWITITSATSGTGTTIIFYKLDTNSGQDQRTGTISVGGQTYYITQSGMSACSYVLSLNSATAPAGGTSNYLNLTTSVGCPYTVTSNASWITITSSATDVANGVVDYTVAPFTGTSPRTGTITIAGLTFTITQASICTYSISPTSASVAAAGGTGGVSVTGASGCPWTAAANANWITITSGASGSGNGTVNYSVGANTAATARTGTATIATQTFTVTQAAAGGGGGGGTGANLLVNGSFEQPGGSDILSATGSTITGWTVVAGTNVDYIHTYFTCSDGAFCLDLDGTPGAGGIAQTFATTPGTAYTVTFDMAGNPGGGPAVKQMRVQAAGQSASFSFDITGHSANSMGWTTKTWTFTANNSSTTLEFDSLDGSSSLFGPALDNVCVTAGSGGGGGGGGGGTCTFSINPTSQNVASSGGSGSVAVTAASGCAWTASSSAGWLSITSGASGSGNGTVSYTVAANTAATAQTGTMTIAGQTFTVTEGAAAVVTGLGPILNDGGVVNAADYTANFAPGMIVSLYGSNFATATTGASTIPLPNNMGGVSVEVVDGSQVLNAPLFFVSQFQINAQLPFNMTSSSVQVRVRNAQGVSGAQTIAITPRNPRLFTQTQDGKGDAVVVHADYSVVNANSPGAPGETLILFLTGLGAVSPAIAAGQAGGDGSSSKPLNLVTDTVSVSVNGFPATVSFRGLAPYYVGLYQVNFQVPADAATGSLPIAVIVGTQISQSQVSLACGITWHASGSATIGASGGTLTAGNLTLTVPAGSFAASTPITVQVASNPGADSDQVGDVFGLTGMPSTTAAPITVSINVPGAAPAPDQTYISLQEPGSGVGPLYLKATVQGNVVSATLPPRMAVANSSMAVGGSKPQANSSMAAAGNQPQADALETLIVEVLTGLGNSDSPSGNFQLLYDKSLTKADMDNLAKSADDIPFTLSDIGFGDAWNSVAKTGGLVVVVKGDPDTSDIASRASEWWGDVRFSRGDAWGNDTIDLSLPQAVAGNKLLAAAKLGHLVMHMLQGRLRSAKVELAQRAPGGSRPWLWMDEATASYFEWYWATGTPVQSASAPLQITTFNAQRFVLDPLETPLTTPATNNMDIERVRWHGWGATYLIRYLSETLSHTPGYFGATAAGQIYAYKTVSPVEAIRTIATLAALLNIGRDVWLPFCRDYFLNWMNQDYFLTFNDINLATPALLPQVWNAFDLSANYYDITLLFGTWTGGTTLTVTAGAGTTVTPSPEVMAYRHCVSSHGIGMTPIQGADGSPTISITNPLSYLVPGCDIPVIVVNEAAANDFQNQHLIPLTVDTGQPASTVLPWTTGPEQIAVNLNVPINLHSLNQPPSFTLEYPPVICGAAAGVTWSGLNFTVSNATGSVPNSSQAACTITGNGTATWDSATNKATISTATFTITDTNPTDSTLYPSGKFVLTFKVSSVGSSGGACQITPQTGSPASYGLNCIVFNDAMFANHTTLVPDSSASYQAYNLTGTQIADGTLEWSAIGPNASTDYPTATALWIEMWHGDVLKSPTANSLAKPPVRK